MSEINNKISRLIDLFEEVKQEVKSLDKWFYERWEAGGFAVDDGFVSMYPNIQEFEYEYEYEDESED